MTKGYFIARWFRVNDAIHTQQKQLFANLGLNYMDLKNLPDNGLNKWNELHKKSHRVADNIYKLILAT